MKLAKLIQLKVRQPSISVDNWNAHLFALQGKKCVAFVHKETFYSFVIFNVLKKDLANFKELFIENFITQLQNDKLLTESIRKSIIDAFSDFQLSTTDGDRSTIGYLNDCITRLTWPRDGRPPTIEESKNYVTHYYNENPLLSKKGVTPKEQMAERLSVYTV